MVSIYKYKLSDSDELTINMPKGAKILSIQVQAGIPCMWVLVDEMADREDRYFQTKGTGQEIPNIEGLTYISTFQEPPFVWHLFERKD